MDAHRQIAEAARAAWDHASALLIAARLTGGTRADLDTLADYADERRDDWLRAEQRARRGDDRRRGVSSTLAALDYGAPDPFAMPDSYGDEFDFARMDYPAADDRT